MKVQITEYLEVDLTRELWCCNRCTKDLGPARENYKKFCLVYDRDPRTIHLAYTEPDPETGMTYAPDPGWCRIVEFYCPQCGVMVENEYLPPGHPLTHDIELDIDALRARHVKA